ncbi:MAG: hypothetical protein DWQ34_23190 [Planctomycetota bacterium]|nr:MAG: hypothetical protein DWQ34_23190 [Planctomycetota bacterium]
MRPVHPFVTLSQHLLIDSEGKHPMILRAAIFTLLFLSCVATAFSQEQAAPWTGHAGPVSAAQFTPDGRIVLSSGLDGTVRIWNAADGALLRTYDEHEGQVLCLAVSPDGRTIATGSRDNTIRLWDVFIPWPLEDRPGPEAPIRALEIAAGGEWSAAASDDKTITVWNHAEKAEPLKLTGHTEPVLTLSASPDETLLAAGDAAGEIRLWNIADGKETGALGAHAGPVAGVAWHPEQPHLLSAGADGTLKWWQTPLTPPRDLLAHPQAVTAIAATADGKLIATAAADKIVRLLDVESGEQTLATKQQPAAIRDVAFAPDGSKFAAADDDGVVRIWVAANGFPLPELRGHAGPARAVAFNADATQLVTAGDDGTARLWMLPAAERIVQGQADAAAAAMSADGKWFAVASSAGDQHTAVVRDAATGAVRATLTDHEGTITSLAFSADAARLITGSADKTARVWNLANGQQLSVFTHEAPVRAVAFSADGNQAFSGGDDNAIKQWTVADGAEVRTIAGHTAALSSLVVAGQRLISGSADSTIRIWNTADGAAVRTINHGQAVTAMDVSADGARIAATGPDKQVRTFTAADGAATVVLPASDEPITRLDWSPDATQFMTATSAAVRVWNLEGQLQEEQSLSGPPLAAGFTPDAAKVRSVLTDGSYHDRPLALVRIFTGHEGPVRGLALSANGAQLLTAGADKSVRLWTVADGTAVRTFAGPQDEVTRVAFSPDGAQVLATSLDKSVHAWALADGAAQAPFVHPDVVTAFTMSRDGTRLATACNDGFIRIWHQATGREWERMPGHAEGTAELSFLGETIELASAGADKLVRISSPAGRRMIVAHETKLSALAITANGAQVATAGDEPVVRFWNTADGAAARQLAGAAAPLICVAIRGDDQQCAAIDAVGKLYLWSLANNQLTHTVEVGAAPEDVAFSADGERVAVTSTTGLIHVYDTTEAQLVQELAAAEQEAQHAIQFGPDRTIVTGGAAGVVHVWAEASPASVGTLSGHSAQVNDLAFSADGATLVSAGSDQTARLWDIATRAQTKQFAGHTGHVYGAAFAPDGARIATAGVDGTVRLWDVAGGNQTSQLTDGETPPPAFDVSFNPDGSMLAACGPDGAIRIWNTASGALERIIAPAENPQPLYAVGYNPAGTRIITCGHAGALTIWNTADGASLFQTNLPAAGYLARPSTDAARLVAACADGVVRIVDVPANAR